MGSYSELLSFGYCKSMEHNLALNIPEAIIKLISLYCTKYKIVGCGKNKYGYLWSNTSSGWKISTSLADIIPNHHSIYPNHDSIMIINQNNQIYAAGYNEACRLGVDWQHTINELRTVELTDHETPKLLSKGIYNEEVTFIYTMNDTLYASGNNYYGLFGNGQQGLPTEGLILQQIPRFWGIDESIISIQCAYHSLFLTDKGNVYSCGLNESQETGVMDKTENILQPERIYSNIRDISVGQCHSVLIDHNNDMIVFGGLVLGTKENAKCILEYFKRHNIKIRAACCGADHALVLDMKYKCYSFGSNRYGQCGNGEQGDIDDFYCIITDPYVHELKLSEYGEYDEYIVDISCGAQHNLVLTNRNKVYSFGRNIEEQCTPFLTDDQVLLPYYLDKEKELKVDKRAFIDKIICLTHESLIIINPNRKLKK